MGSEGAQVLRFADLLSEPVRNGIYKEKRFHGRGVKIVNMGELFANRRLGDVPMRRVELADRELQKAHLEEGDLLFARRSLVAEGAGRCTFVSNVREPTVFESSIIRARPDKTRFDSRYLFYFFESSQGRELMHGILRQVAVAGITGSDLSNLEVPVPELGIQRRVADTLSSLDDRIDNLRATNATLEAVAQALFKSWFVDFDPVHAKADGRAPAGMDAATAALFPSEFEDSELGPIPKGWRVAPFGELVEIVGGGTPKTAVADYWNGTIPWFSVVDAPDATQVFTLDTAKKVTEIGLASCSATLLPERTTIISARGTVGKVAMTGVPMAMNQSCYALRTKVDRGDSFIYFLTLHAVAQLQRVVHGAVFDTITRDSFHQIQVPVPDSITVAAFANTADPLLDRILSNRQQATTLAHLRDALLPRLISGKLRLPDAETEVEDAVTEIAG